MAVGIYDRAFLYLDGALEAEQESGTYAIQGDPLPVATMGKEFGGITPTPKSLKADISEFVPISGGSVKKIFNGFKAHKKFKLRIQLGGSGLIMESEGYLMPPSITTGAADHTKLNYSFLGTAPDIN